MPRQFIAAIAGSAGSQQPLETLFSYVPEDDVAYVIIRHLPTGFKSQLKMILARRSPLPIREIRQGMLIRNNTIYIAPGDKYITIRRDIFHCHPRIGNVHQGGDVFMRSLAENSGPRAMAVILSGALWDGSSGVRMVHARGGLTLAQTPETCLFPSMPEHAIRTGCVQQVLDCSQMGDVIHRYAEKNDPAVRRAM